MQGVFFYAQTETAMGRRTDGFWLWNSGGDLADQRLLVPLLGNRADAVRPLCLQEKMNHILVLWGVYCSSE